MPVKTTGRKFEYAVLMGRFEPCHLGHITLYREAFKIADHVIILAGSADCARSTDNPFTVDERDRMITLVVENELNEPRTRYSVIGVRDHYYDDDEYTQWKKNVQKAVDSVVHTAIFGQKDSVCLVGYHKDAKTGEYLDSFPQWAYHEVSQQGPLSATEIRELYWTTTDEEFEKLAGKVLHHTTLHFLLSWKKSDEYKALVDDYLETEETKKKWMFSPYTPTFNASDACVIESGHVLLIQRDKAPGKGLWALPGGHIDGDESVFDGCIRELIEETDIDCPEKIIRGNVKVKNHLFDKPDRDARGRYFSHGSLFILPSQPGKLSAVKGKDDARAARWVHLSELDSGYYDKMFADHYHIIQKLIGLA